MPEEIIIKVIRIDSEQAVDALDQIEQSTDDVKKSTESLDTQLQQMPGPLGKVRQGLQAVNKTFKAMLANPLLLAITALVAIFATLGKAFTKTQAGADKLKEVMAALGAAVDVVTERAAKLFQAFGKIFKGEFREGFDDMKESVSGVKDEIVEATKAAIEYERAINALYESETELLTVNAERRQQIAELVFQSRDLTLSVQERRDAIVEADRIEKEILADQIALQTERLRLAEMDLANLPEELRQREDIRKVEEQRAMLVDLETQSLTRQRELKNRLNELDNQALASAKAIATEQERIATEQQAQADARRKEELAASKEEYDLDQQFKQDMADADLQRDQEYAALKQEIDDETTQGIIDNVADRLAAEEDAIARAIMAEYQLKDAKMSIYQDALSGIIGLLGEGSAVGRALQIADATRSAIQGAINAYTSTAAIPGIGTIWAPLAAAAAALAGMANVRKMASVPQPLGGGGGSVPSVSLAQPTSALNIDDIVNADQSIPSDVSIIQDRTTREPGRAYVVESEMTAKQEIERQRQVEASL